MDRHEQEIGAEPFRGETLQAEAVVDGPAIIDMATTGIVVPPGTRVVRTERGDFILTFGS